MRNQVREIREAEGTLPEEPEEEMDKVRRLMNTASSSANPNDTKIEPEFSLPFGLGFDHIIKSKMDLINNNKFKNNKLMDELVTKVGYLDYRDALAANKYILEAKRHGDYHQ